MNNDLNKTNSKYSEIITNQKWKKLLSKEDINYFVEKCANHLNNLYRDCKQKIIVVCILKGAVYFHVDLTRLLNFPISQYHIEVSSYGNDKIQKDTIEILSLIQNNKFENKKVILIDELFDNGNTIMEVKQKIHEYGNVNLNDIYTCTLFKKNKQSSEDNNLDFYGVMVPNVWLVGYGLDYKQEMRELEELYGCPKDENVPKTSDDLLFDNDFDKLIKFIQNQK